MSPRIQRHSTSAPSRAHSTPQPVQAQAAKAPAKPQPSRQQGHSIKDSFDRINRNDKDGHIDVSDLVGAHIPLPPNPGKIRGDKNGDNRLNFDEFKAAYKKATHSSKKGGGHPTPVQEHHVAYKMQAGHSATLRTHASGLVDGRVQGGDTFIASHKKGDWVYGHVKGHPDRKGWVLAGQLPKVKAHDMHNGELRPGEKVANARRPTSAERAEGTRNPVDLRDRSDFQYLDGKDKKAIQYLQGGLSPQIHAGDRVGYTTPVKAKDPSKPIKVYANYPCTEANELKRDGKTVEIPAGEDVKFRYSPDGKNAVVMVSGQHGGKDAHGTWGIVPLNQLEVPKGTPGFSPLHFPVTHH